MSEMYALNGPHFSEVLLPADEGNLYDEGMANNRENHITL